MTQYKDFLVTIWHEYKQHWFYFLILISGVNLLVDLLVIPLFQFGVSGLLQLGNITYLSYTNFLTIFMDHPFVSLGLVILISLLLFVTFLQFVFVLRGIVQIRQHRFYVKSLIAETKQVVLHTNWKTSILFFAYLFLLLPFFSVFFLNSPLLSKIVIPQFIFDEIVMEPLYFIPFLCIVAILFYFGIRFVLTLPEIIIRPKRFSVAMMLSWQRTKNKFLFYALRYALIAALLFVVTNALYLGIYGIQSLFDLLPAPFPVIAVAINLTLVQLIHFLLNMFAIMAYSSIFIDELIEETPKPLTRNMRPLYRRKYWLLSIISVSVVAYNMLYSSITVEKEPVTISHRGVSEANGVQNTIEAMERTMKLNPDYIEMDVQETKDHQFVVMHDKNLSKLAGVNKAPQELTLQQLTKLTVTENGYTAKVASFDAYLKHADAHGQKLLVELKTSSLDSKNMVKNFIDQYGDKLEENHHRMQTLSHQAAEALKKDAPNTFVSYILPFNFSFPTTDFDAYTMEQTTLNATFTSKALLANKEVFVWTVNSADDIRRSLFLNVDGIITDDLETLNGELESFKEEPTFADQILMYVMLYSDR